MVMAGARAVCLVAVVFVVRVNTDYGIVKKYSPWCQARELVRRVRGLPGARRSWKMVSILIGEADNNDDDDGHHPHR